MLSLNYNHLSERCVCWEAVPSYNWHTLCATSQWVNIIINSNMWYKCWVASQVKNIYTVHFWYKNYTTKSSADILQRPSAINSWTNGVKKAEQPEQWLQYGSTRARHEQCVCFSVKVQFSTIFLLLMLFCDSITQYISLIYEDNSVMNIEYKIANVFSLLAVYWAFILTPWSK